MVEAQLFKALGDPTRLKLLERLAVGTDHTINHISADLGITRQGARKHLGVLANAKLIRLQPKGRDVQVTLEPQSLEVARAFIAKLEQQWDRRLTALKRFVEE